MSMMDYLVIGESERRESRHDDASLSKDQWNE